MFVCFLRWVGIIYVLKRLQLKDVRKTAEQTSSPVQCGVSCGIHNDSWGSHNEPPVCGQVSADPEFKTVGGSWNTIQR